MMVLMHICCSNCAIYPIHTLQLRGVDIRGFWFNPNIHPYTEYRNRLDSLRRLQEIWKLDVEYYGNYGLIDFLKNVVNNEKNRCKFCYSVRMDKTAEIAKESGADAFTTSLLVSPYQNIDMIKEVGYSLQNKYGVEFYFEDFRVGFGEGRRMAKAMDLYRQKYCGCIYSEMERHMETPLNSDSSTLKPT